MANGQKRIFVSHASKDKVLADKLVDLLTTGCAVNPNDILCTSLDGKGIPVGSGSFIEYLHEQIQKPDLVILLISENFFASHFCVCELGAVWGMNLKNFPLVVPPTDKGKLKAVLLNAQVGEIDRSKSLDELKDVIHALLGTTVPTPTWTVKSQIFLSQVKEVIESLESPKIVSSEQLESVKANFDAAMLEAKAKGVEITNLKLRIADLERCKDSVEVSKVREKYSSSKEQYDDLLSQAEGTMKKLHRGTRKVFFHALRGDHYTGDGDWNEISAAEELQEIHVSHGMGASVTLNSEHIRVSKAEAAIRALSDFLGASQNKDFVSQLEEDYEFPMSIQNKEFWESVLGVYV